jgi:hypothetical protein
MQPAAPSATETCPLCATRLAPTDARCPACNADLAGVGARAGPFSRVALWWAGGTLVVLYAVVLVIVLIAR